VSTTAFRDGVHFVQLASIIGPALVPSTLALELGVEERPGEGLAETLARLLRERELLLCLDNFEQLLPAAPFVAELLACCPRLRLLVTSRSPRHLADGSASRGGQVAAPSRTKCDST
jgi:predicted ATPase